MASYLQAIFMMCPNLVRIQDFAFAGLPPFYQVSISNTPLEYISLKAFWTSEHNSTSVQVSAIYSPMFIPLYHIGVIYHISCSVIIHIYIYIYIYISEIYNVKFTFCIDEIIAYMRFLQHLYDGVNDSA